MAPPRRRADRPLPVLGKAAERRNPAAFIGTLAEGVQARHRHNGRKSHKSFAYGRFSAAARHRKCGTIHAMRIALYEPDIPQNTGTILRLAACLGVEAHIIEPAGFPISDRAFRRAGMDYLDQVTIVRHASWAAFEDWRRAEAAAAGPVHHHAAPLLSRSRLPGRRHPAVRPRIRRRAGRRCMRPPTRG